MKPPFIPQRTRMELANPATPGSRHTQMIKIAMPLIGNGFPLETVFRDLRGIYDSTVTDAEIREIIKWAQSKNLVQADTPVAATLSHLHSITMATQSISEHYGQSSRLEAVKTFLQLQTCAALPLKASN